MHHIAGSIAFTLLWSVATAAVQGFNYGSQGGANGVKVEADYEFEFLAAQSLAGTDGAFTSARLYTMCQGPSTDPIEAIPAAINTNTTLLLGLWASAGDSAFDGQIQCLENAIKQYPEAGPLIVGISVGSEDLYRITPTALENSKLDGAEPPIGAEPDVVISYIKKTRDAIKGTPYQDAAVGHVDTWSVWVDGANKGVVDNCDWLGFDGYPYWEKGNGNNVDNGRKLFKEALDKTRAAAPGKPIWITETGWPTAGSTVGDAVASPENAQQYWQEVGCGLFGKTNTWWFTLQGMPDDAKEPSWGVLDAQLNKEPVFGLSCKGVKIPEDFEDSVSDGETESSNSPTGSGSGSDGEGSDGEEKPNSAARCLSTGVSIAAAVLVAVSGLF